MKILHLGDLHIGKKVCGYSMDAEIKNALNQAVNLIKEKEIEIILISGDIFDKPVVSANALEIFSDFLAELNSLKTTVYIIPGNHDNSQRLAYMASFLKKSDIIISKPFDGIIEKHSYNDNIDIYLAPFLQLAEIKKHFKDIEINSYNDGFKALLSSVKIDKSKINILLAHQFVTGENEELILTDSEQKSVGGIDSISFETLKDFDYTALGHLHCPQKIGNSGIETIRYSGSPVKYSFSEINQKKYFTVVEITSKNDIKISKEKIIPIHDFKEYRGYIEEFLNEEFNSKINKNDYIRFVLLDEAVLDAKKKLSMIYPNIMIIEFENSFTNEFKNGINQESIKNKDIFEHFKDFYKNQYGYELSNEKETLTKELISNLNSFKGGKIASL